MQDKYMIFVLVSICPSESWHISHDLNLDLCFIFMFLGAGEVFRIRSVPQFIYKTGMRFLYVNWLVSLWSKSSKIPDLMLMHYSTITVLVYKIIVCGYVIRTNCKIYNETPKHTRPYTYKSSFHCKALLPIGLKSDHDIVLYDTTIQPSRFQPTQRKLFLW